jgi:peptidoglycan/LPS O-acetylase OafA/YrhL
VSAEFFFYAAFPFVTALLGRRLRSPGTMAAGFVLRCNEFLAGCLAGHYFLQTRGRSRYA